MSTAELAKRYFGTLAARDVQSAVGVPHPAFNLDTEQARASMRKLAALEPRAAWPATPNRSEATWPGR